MKKFKNIRPNDIIVVNNLKTNMYCLVKNIVKYDDINNMITLEIYDMFMDKLYITPELYMNVSHVVDDKSNTYNTTPYNYDTFYFMYGFNLNTNVPTYQDELMKAKYGTDTNIVDDITYERDNIDKCNNQISCILDNAIQHYNEMTGYYEYIQRVRPKRIEKLILHVV